VLGDGDELLLARQVQTHRPPRQVRQRGCQRLDRQIAFRTIRPAQGGHDHPHRGQREPKDLGELRAQQVRRLDAGPHRESAGYELGDACMRLEWHVLDRGTRKGVFEDVLGFGEAGVDVALAELEVVAHVRVRSCMDDQVGKGDTAARRARVNEWRTIRECFGRLEDRGQFLVVHFDQAQRRVRHIRVLGHHRRHRIADEAYLVHGQNCLIAEHRPEVRPDVRTLAHVIAGQHERDTRQGACLVDRDAPESGVRERAAQDARVEHARYFVVDDVVEPAGDPCASVEHARAHHSGPPCRAACWMARRTQTRTSSVRYQAEPRTRTLATVRNVVGSEGSTARTSGPVSTARWVTRAPISSRTHPSRIR
jgi:hypothetical protein